MDRKAARINQNIGAMDIEDLVKLGKQYDICPYFYSKSQLAASDILILPYQYILQTDIRK